MKKETPREQSGEAYDGGFFRWIIALIVIIVIFAYFKIDFRAFVGHTIDYFGQPNFLTNTFYTLLDFFHSLWVNHLNPYLSWLGDAVLSLLHMR